MLQPGYPASNFAEAAVSFKKVSAKNLQDRAARLPARTALFFYRTQDGTEADIVIAPGGLPEKLVEITFSDTPKVSRGFRTAIRDLNTKENYIVCPVAKGYPIDIDIEVVGIKELDKLELNN